VKVGQGRASIPYSVDGQWFVLGCGQSNRVRARLLQVETEGAGIVSGFVVRIDGKLQRIQAGVYLLAMGAIETPRMMLASSGRFHPAGIGNHNDQVGRNLMETISINLLCRTDQAVHSYKGPPLDNGPAHREA